MEADRLRQHSRDQEHLALVKGDLSGPDPVLVRMHAVDLLDDMTGGPHWIAVHNAMDMISQAGRGAVVLIRDHRRTALSDRVRQLAMSPVSTPSCATTASVLRSCSISASTWSWKKFKSMRQRVTDRKTELAQAERVQENVHLMADAHGAVLQIAIIKAESGIEQDFFHAVALCDFNLAGKIIAHRLIKSALKSRSPTSRTFLPCTKQIITAASFAATILKISFEAAVPVKFKIFAPASRQARATFGE